MSSAKKLGRALRAKNQCRNAAAETSGQAKETLGIVHPVEAFDTEASDKVYAKLVCHLLGNASGLRVSCFGIYE